jgi:hypothetical protein
MWTRFHRAERCRDRAQERRSSAAVCAPSTEIRIRYSRMADHFSTLAEAEERAHACLRAVATSTVPT